MFTGANNTKDFIDYVISSQGWGDEKRNTVDRALKITMNSLINRQRWEFRRKESNFTLTADTATYDLSANITDFKSNPIISVSLNQSPPLTYLPVDQFDTYKKYKVAGEKESSKRFQKSW